MLLSVAFVRFRDIEPIWNVVLQVLFYASGVFFTVDDHRAAEARPALRRPLLLQPVRGDPRGGAPHRWSTPRGTSPTQALSSDWLLLDPGRPDGRLGRLRLPALPRRRRRSPRTSRSLGWHPVASRRSVPEAPSPAGSRPRSAPGRPSTAPHISGWSPRSWTIQICWRGSMASTSSHRNTASASTSRCGVSVGLRARLGGLCPRRRLGPQPSSRARPGAPGSGVAGDREPASRGIVISGAWRVVRLRRPPRPPVPRRTLRSRRLRLHARACRQGQLGLRRPRRARERTPTRRLSRPPASFVGSPAQEAAHDDRPVRAPEDHGWFPPS